jgi:hypothetical protein
MLKEVIENAITMHLRPGAEWVLLCQDTVEIETNITLDNRAEVQLRRRQGTKHFDNNMFRTTSHENMYTALC